MGVGARQSSKEGTAPQELLGSTVLWESGYCGGAEGLQLPVKS